MEEYKSKNKELQEKYNNLVIGTITSTMIVVGALTLTALSPSIGLGIAALAAGTGCLCYKNSQKVANTAKRFDRENKHIEKIKDEIDTDYESQSERTIKLLSLAKSRRETERKLEYAEAITLITYGITMIGAITTFVNPIAVWIPLIGITGSLAAGHIEIKNHRNREVIESKFNNLNYDVEVVEELNNEQEIENEKLKEKEQNNSNVLEDYFSIEENEEEQKAYNKAYIKRKGGK